MTSKMPAARHYVIVVHGMGVQKESVTAYEVIHRFAEVRRRELRKDEDFTYHNLLPPSLSSQSVLSGMGHGWAEFGGIPIDPADDTGIFDGLPPTGTSGRNFRFVDLRWSQILAEDERDYACQMKQWTEALRVKFDTVAPQKYRPRWVGPLLQQIEDSALTVEAALRYFQPKLATLIFDEILGGIHLYGDYARTRGKAVRHFHFVLDEICLRDFIDWCRYEKGGYSTYRLPEFTVIAHSLGSIMSYDALLYACAQQDIREESRRPRHPCPSLPFPAYTEQATAEPAIWRGLTTQLKELGEINSRPDLTQFNIPPTAPIVPMLLWRNCIKAFITIGSPIDKFHALWYQNYLHMGFPLLELPSEWDTEWLKEPERKIKHFNLCDEQDPVGHHLDIAQSTRNYAKVFDTALPVAYRDVTFRRYPVPALAHIEYWRDRKLFEGIVHHVMELGHKEQPPDPTYFANRLFREDGDNAASTYRKILVWAYFRIPLIVAMATGLLLVYGIISLIHGTFSMGPVLAIAAAILLWIRPYSTHAYRAEIDHRIKGKPLWKWWRIVKLRWKPRRSLFANLAAAGVEWRRILILQSVATEEILKNAVDKGVRLGFKTSGGFWRRAWRRFAIGLVCFALGAWCLWHLHTTSDTSHPYPFLLTIGVEAIAILSLCYLLTMGFVTWVFMRAKKAMKTETARTRRGQQL